MNDRFKFRIWDKYEKSYWLQSTLEQNIHWLMNPEEYKDANYPPDCVKIEQCTGLRDKNGKLIYEGDICIPAKDMADNYGEIYRAESGTYSIKGKMKDGMEYDFGIYWHISDYEVVGNIHENEELLCQH